MLNIISILVDNITFTDEHFLGEPGLCYWIEAEGKKILFDLGFSDTYIRNAKKLKISLSKTNYIILSHGHNDHTEGLKFFPFASKKIQLISHPDCLLPKYVSGDQYIGSPLNKEIVSDKFSYIQSEKPYFITPNSAFLGRIKEKYDFEEREPIGFIIRNNKKENDLLFDDSALAIKTKKGVVIITGCSHSGICNIVASVKEIFKGEKIYSIIGGFHLRKSSMERLEETMKVLKKEVMGLIYPAHCTDFGAKCFLAKHLKTEKVYVSKKIIFNEN